MTNSKLLPAAALAVMAALGGAVVVSAQTAEPAAPADDTTAPAVEAPAADAPAATDTPATSAGFFGFGVRGHDHGPGGRGGDLLGGVLVQADVDGDGAVTQAEIDAVRATLVGGADASGEGDLSLEDFQAVSLELVRPQMVDAFQDLDEDGDAAVTAAELDTRLGGVVAQLDQDSDGSLSAADRPERGDRDGDGNGPRGEGRRG